MTEQGDEESRRLSVQPNEPKNHFNKTINRHDNKKSQLKIQKSRGSKKGPVKSNKNKKKIAVISKGKMHSDSQKHGDKRKTEEKKRGRNQARRAGNNQGVLDFLCPFLSPFYKLLATFIPANLLSVVLK